jgi:hypothetical protein
MKKNKKILICGFLIVLIGIGFFAHELSKPNLTLYPKLNKDIVELYLLKEKFNFELLESMEQDPFPFINITITDGRTSKSGMISVEKLNLDQSKCTQKWDCPVLKMTSEKFHEKFNKGKKLENITPESIVNKAFESDITDDVE